MRFTALVVSGVRVLLAQHAQRRAAIHAAEQVGREDLGRVVPVQEVVRLQAVGQRHVGLLDVADGLADRERRG